jgi:predicted GH43/DUF377 family glycosyl hydrolase
MYVAIIRHGKPILRPHPAIPEVRRQVYNAGAIEDDGWVHLFPRIRGGDSISRIAHVVSKDGINFMFRPWVMQPAYPWESVGCEDPRVVYLPEDRLYAMTYTAYDGKTARLGLATSSDLYHFYSRSLMIAHWRGYTHPNASSRDWSKAAGLIPQRIDGTYVALFGDYQIWLASSADLATWMVDDEPVLTTRPGQWDGGYIEMGPPMVRIPEGWLGIYHGVHRIDHQDGDPRVYRWGAFVLDAHNPRKVLYRSSEPFFWPQGWERLGYLDIDPGFERAYDTLTEEEIEELVRLGKVSQVVFCCGMVPIGEREFRFYYGAADRFVGTCTGRVEEMELVSV